MYISKRCHIIKNPAGTFSFIGSVPATLGNKVKATRADVAGQRSWTDKEGKQVTMHFPAFPSPIEAYNYALTRDVKINSFSQ